MLRGMTVIVVLLEFGCHIKKLTSSHELLVEASAAMMHMMLSYCLTRGALKYYQKDYFNLFFFLLSEVKWWDGIAEKPEKKMKNDC